MFGRSLFFQSPGAFQIKKNATMDTISTVSSITPASPRPLFTGFPYFVTRLAPANYHFILLPAKTPLDKLQELALCQAALNDLPSCLVLDERHCFYLENGSKDGPSEKPPRGGIVYSGGLKPVTPILDTLELAWRYRLFDGFAKGLNGSRRIVFGDLTKGGREASPAELRKLRGERKDGVPRGLRHCRTCGDWFGQCLDPAPSSAGKSCRSTACAGTGISVPRA
jgi:hypothetical protein